VIAMTSTSTEKSQTPQTLTEFQNPATVTTLQYRSNNEDSVVRRLH